eukprot:gene32316-16887_t
MMEEDFDRELKVLVIGNGSVGKTSMIRRFCKGIYTDEYKKTIGVDFLEKALFVDMLQEEVRFMLWDTAGQEEFDAITRTYYRGGGAAVIAFSTTDRASFDAIPMWKAKIEAECGDIALALVQNKVDLLDEAAASAEEVEELARKHGMKLYRTCVKENLNVTEVFVYLAELHQRKVQAGQLGQPVQLPGSQPVGGADEQPDDESQEGDGGRQVFSAGNEPVPEGRARTVTLEPSRKRTKGKKSFSGRMTACSVL